jgi:hypothetical protein
MPAPKPTTLAALTPDPQNARTHGDRNLEMIAASLRDVGPARSIVIDEDGVVLAGNGVRAAAALAGLEKLRIIDAAGDEVIAVRRSGLTAGQKQRLAIYDNRTAELAEWNPATLAAAQDAGLDLAPFFSTEELATLFGAGKPTMHAGSLAERFGVPPFTVLDARQGYWQDRKRAWLSLGIQSELGRGAAIVPNGSERPPDQDGVYLRHSRRANATVGGAPLPGIRGPRKDYKPGQKTRKASLTTLNPTDSKRQR